MAEIINSEESYDLESFRTPKVNQPVGMASPYTEAGQAVVHEISTQWGLLSAMVRRVVGRLRIEKRGIERVPEDERTDTSHLRVGSIWLSVNMVVNSFAVGILGKSRFDLGLSDAILTILFFNLLGVIPVCYFSCFGPVFGLRQMVLSRFWFGWYGVKLLALLNIVTCIGWSTVSAILGAQLIHAVNPNVPGSAGILVIAFCTFMVSLFGYELVHIYSLWSWIPTFIVFLIVLGEFARTGDFISLPMGIGTSEMGKVLSFGSVIYGFSTCWSSYAADYTVYQPSSQSPWKILLCAWLGITFPLLFTEILGVVIISATTANNGDNIYKTRYDMSGTGGLLAAVLFPHLGQFGKFCLIILALSIIASECPNIYSLALNLQVLARQSQRIPRFLWTFIGVCVYVGIAVPGYAHFEPLLQNCMDLVGYWLAIYEGIVLTDHFAFRRGFDGYRIEDYDQPGMLPPGFAAVGAFCCGIAGVMLGMSQPWYVGPIALEAGKDPDGGDVGFEMGFAFAILGYFLLRPIEKRYLGR